MLMSLLTTEDLAKRHSVVCVSAPLFPARQPASRLPVVSCISDILSKHNWSQKQIASSLA